MQNTNTQELAPSEKIKRCPNSPGWYHEKTTGLHAMHCKARNCEVCGEYWSYKWRSALKEKAEYDKAMGIPTPELALTLTFRAQVDYKICYAVLRYFWQLVRQVYPNVEYWGVVEYNQHHTQPHLHFVLGGSTFIPFEFIRNCWIKAQNWGGIEDPAFITRIEKIRGNIQQYFTKYITKLTGGKDEIPRREQWQGRYIRYSKKFFPTSVPAMAVYASWRRQWEADLYLWQFRSYSVFKDRACLAGVSGFIDRAIEADGTIDYWVNRDWNPLADKLKAEKISIDNQPELPLSYRVISTLPNDGRTFIQTCRDMASRQNLDN